MKLIRLLIQLLLITIIGLTVAACGAADEKRFEAEFMLLFDTTTRIIGYAENKEVFSDHVQMIYDDLEIYHQLYDIYNNYEGINNIKTINDNAGKKPVKVDQQIIDLLLFAKQMYYETNGEVNIAFGSVLKIWHDYREEATYDSESAAVPPLDILKEAEKHTAIEDIIIDESNSTVFLKDGSMSLDVGSIAKGYAVEQVCKSAIERGFDSGIVSVGGNVKTIGYKNDKGGLWNIGVQNPDKETGGDLLRVNLTDVSLVTSGDYIRYYTVDGKRYHHIIDPETLYPADYFTAVTIVTQDSARADALSTAVFNMPYEDGFELIENLDETESLWIFQNGETRYSTGFEAFIQ